MDSPLAARFHIHPQQRTGSDRLLNRTKPIIRLYRFVRAERGTRTGLSLRKRIRAWRHGFFSRSYVLYELERNDPRDYLPDACDIDFAINDPHYCTLGNKLSFSRLMELYGVPHPEVLALLSRGWTYAFDEQSSGDSLTVVIRKLLEEHGQLVMKPVLAGGGRGIIFVQRDDALGVVANGEPIRIKELIDLITRLEDYYVSTYETQAAYAAALYPGIPNTVRVLTLWDYERNKPFVAAAVQRIGSSRSFPVDSFHYGGLGAQIGIESGKLGPALTLDNRGRLSQMTHHPETGQPIEGIQVTHWQETKGLLLLIAERLPQTPFVGWDVLVTEGGCRVLEANCPPAVQVWQAHQPLLTDFRSRRFFETIGMIRR